LANSKEDINANKLKGGDISSTCSIANNQVMKYFFSVVTLLIFATQSCTNTKVDLEKEKKEIMILQNEQRRAHMEKNAALLVGDGLSDFVEVNGGVVEIPARSENIKRFQLYFNSVDFIRWDDVAPPIISFSDDGTMATTVVEKLVITRQKLEDNRLDTTHYAWLAVYKKVNGKWKLHRMCSTNR
jgi:hypothetical protein